MRQFSVYFLSLLLALTIVQPGAAHAAPKRTVSLKAPTSAIVAKNFSVSGKVTKSRKGTKVTIQRKTKTSAWKTVKTIKTSSKSGAFRWPTAKVSGSGSFYFRATVSKNSKKKLKSASSATRKVSASWLPGSMKNPYRVGEAFSIPDWRVSFGATTSISLADFLGLSQVSVPVTVTRRASTPGNPSHAMFGRFFAADGQVYDVYGLDYEGVHCEDDDTFRMIGLLTNGTPATGTICAIVPTTFASAGSWLVTDVRNFSEVFIRPR